MRLWSLQNKKFTFRTSKYDTKYQCLGPVTFGCSLWAGLTPTLYICREYKNGFVYYVLINEKRTSPDILAPVPPNTISSAINFVDPNGMDYTVLTDTDEAYRHRHFFCVPLKISMKYVDIPPLLTALGPVWQASNRGEGS